MDMEAKMAMYTRKTAKVAFLTALAASCVTRPAFAAEKEITPYIEVNQVIDADLKNGGDVLTYTALAAGIDASVQTRRAEFQVNYRYERRFDWQKDVDKEDIHTGLARARVDIAPDLLSFEAGALAARGRTDIRGEGDQLGVGNSRNISQVYTAYAGPSLATNIGPVEVAAAYRAGYTKVEANDRLTLPTGQERLDSFDDSVTHYATASIGMAPGDVIPVGWTVSGGYERENASQLKGRFEDMYVRGDLTVPVTDAIALVGGVGYEKLKASQKGALLDAVTGAPVVDSDGRFVTDPASTRQLSYEFDGIYWDAGVSWRPNNRTALEARVGRRYGSMTYYGSFEWQMSQNSGLQIGVYDEVETFGQQLNDNLSSLPTRYNFGRSSSGGLRSNSSGCVFADAGGGCLNDAFQSINTGVYRSRGVGLAYSSKSGRTSTGLGLGYNQRKFFAPAGAVGGNVNGVKDESFYAQATMSYALSQRGTFTGDLYGDYYMPGLANAGNVLSVGATGSYIHNFTRSLSGNLAAGVNAFKQQDFDSDVSVSGLAGLRYSF
jgi:hypothetical protein